MNKYTLSFLAFSFLGIVSFAQSEAQLKLNTQPTNVVNTNTLPGTISTGNSNNNVSNGKPPVEHNTIQKNDFPKELKEITDIQDALKYLYKDDLKAKKIDHFTNEFEIKLDLISPNYPVKSFLPIDKKIILTWYSNHPNELSGYKELISNLYNTVK